MVVQLWISSNAKENHNFNEDVLIKCESSISYSQVYSLMMISLASITGGSQVTIRSTGNIFVNGKVIYPLLAVHKFAVSSIPIQIDGQSTVVLESLHGAITIGGKIVCVVVLFSTFFILLGWTILCNSQSLQRNQH